MKEYNLLKKEQEKANPTIETQEKILEVLRYSERPISITQISKLAKTSFNQAKTSVKFLSRLGVLELIISSGNTTFVILNKKEVKNGITISN